MRTKNQLVTAALLEPETLTREEVNFLYEGMPLVAAEVWKEIQERAAKRCKLVSPEDLVPFKNLGNANSWRATPIELVLCSNHKHIMTETRLGNCWSKHTCDICRHYYDVDSGD